MGIPGIYVAVVGSNGDRRTVLAGSSCYRQGHWSVVDACDSDSNGLRCTHPTVVVGGGVAEADVTAGAVSQVVKGGARIKAVAAVSIEGECTIAGADTGNQLVIGDGTVYVNGHRNSAAKDCVLAGGLSIGKGNRYVVFPGDCDGDGLGRTRPAVVGDGVGEGVGRCNPIRKTVEMAGRIVGEGAVAVYDDTAKRAGVVEAEGVSVAGIGIAEVRCDDNRRTVLVGGCRYRQGHGSTVLASDSDSHGLS